MEKYIIITDLDELQRFVDWLPELQENECYYLCLFARNKYVRDTPEYFPHIKADKAQIKRFLVSRKQDFITKIKQLEVEVGAYVTKENLPIPQQSLALYVTVNPRNQHKALIKCMKQFCDILETQGTGFNIQQEALSAIQKSVSRKLYMDLDFDTENVDDTVFSIKEYVNPSCITIVKTRGGFHCLIDLKNIDKKYEKTWYNKITSLEECDIVKDAMLPVPGTYQGGFTPTLKTCDSN